MSAFDTYASGMLDQIYALYADAASWRPAAGGPAIAVKVLRRARDEDLRFDGASAFAQALTAKVRASVLTPLLGDEFTVTLSGGGTADFRVIADPTRSLNGQEWLCELRAL